MVAPVLFRHSINTNLHIIVIIIMFISLLHMKRDIPFKRTGQGSVK